MSSHLANLNGTIKITCVRAAGIPRKQMMGKQDPYVRISYGSSKAKSKTAKDGDKNPVWNEELSIEAKDSAEKDIRIIVKNDNFGIDDEICIVKFPIFALLSWPGEEKWYPLFKEEGHKRQAGQILLKATFEGTGGLPELKAPQWGIVQATYGNGSVPTVDVSGLLEAQATADNGTLKFAKGMDCSQYFGFDPLNNHKSGKNLIIRYMKEGAVNEAIIGECHEDTEVVLENAAAKAQALLEERQKREAARRAAEAEKLAKEKAEADKRAKLQADLLAQQLEQLRLQKMQAVQPSITDTKSGAEVKAEVKAEGVEKAGCYWKYEDIPTVFWASAADKAGTKDVQFYSPEEYFKHRAQNGWPKDWSAITTLPPAKGCYFNIGKAPWVYWSMTGKPDQTDIKFLNSRDFIVHYKNQGWTDDSVKVINIPTFGCYWKHVEDVTVYFSQSVPGVKHVAFEDEKEYMEHRFNHGFEKDWKGIVEMRKGFYWRAENLVHVHWNEKTAYPPAEVTFKNSREYLVHRRAHGAPLDGSNIKIVKGCYWGYNGEDTVWWAEDGKAGTETIAFPNAQTYLHHRKLLGFPEDGTLIQRISKGFYWKAETLPHVHWNEKTAYPPAEVTFQSSEEYMKHRAEHGMPEDWSDIKIVKGCYWGYNGEDTVWWAEDGKAGTETIAFPNAQTYLHHRKLLGFPEDGTLIQRILPKGFYWRAEKLPHVHWNLKTAYPPAEVTFKNSREYLEHRAKHGAPLDGSDIKVVKGCYWGKNGEATIWWAEDGKVGTETYAFPNPEEYMEHRRLLGFPLDFSLIERI
eukprot:jgi/Bigna1/89630/estExt_fgenesh1_pg.C_520145